jgi:hypothetical protein
LSAPGPALALAGSCELLMPVVRTETRGPLPARELSNASLKRRDSRPMPHCPASKKRTSCPMASPNPQSRIDFLRLSRSFRSRVPPRKDGPAGHAASAAIYADTCRPSIHSTRSCINSTAESPRVTAAISPMDRLESRARRGFRSVICSTACPEE